MRTSIVVAALGMLLLVSLGPLLQTAGADEGRSVVRQRAQEHVFTWNGNAWLVEARFPVALEDHRIDVPVVVKDNIAPVIDVDVQATLDPR